MKKLLFLLSALAMVVFLAAGCAERGTDDMPGDTTGTADTMGTEGTDTGTTDTTGTGTTDTTTGTETGTTGTTTDPSTGMTTDPSTGTTGTTTDPSAGTTGTTGTPGTETMGAAGDAELRTNIQTTLTNQGIDTTNVTFTVNNGVVTLTGNVASEAEAERIVNAVRSVSNVSSVNNQLTVGGASE